MRQRASGRESVRVGERVGEGEWEIEGGRVKARERESNRGWERESV